jgi:hypothetical protein
MAPAAEPLKNQPTLASYRPAEHIQWSVEPMGILLFDQKAGCACAIAYPQAAVWDFLTRQYPLGRIIDLLGSIADLKAAEAHAFLQNSLAMWLAAGYLIRGDGHG